MDSQRRRNPNNQEAGLPQLQQNPSPKSRPFEEDLKTVKGMRLHPYPSGDGHMVIVDGFVR